VSKKIKIDMSEAAVTARLRRAGGLGDIERMAMRIRLLVAEIRGEKAIAELPFWQLKERETAKTVQ
jgi:hypothetical protein